jgi:hypothetical protein
MRQLCLGAFLSLISFTFSFAQNYQSTIGSSGSGNNQYNDPVQSAVAANGNLYVLDRGNNRVQVLDGNGNFQFAFGSAGGGPGQFQTPEGIAISPNNYVYVVDAGHYKVQAFDLSGVWQFEFGSQGAGNGLFLSPVGVAVNSLGQVYVSESNRVQKFDQFGNFISIVGTNNTGSNAYDSPRFLEVDRSTDNVYVTDWYGEVLVYNSSGVLVNTVNVGGPTLDVAVSSSYVYVVRNDNTIQKYTLGLSFITSFGGTGGGSGTFSQLTSIEIENNFDRLYLTDVGLDDIQIFNDVVEPTTQTSTLIFSNVNSNSVDLSWNAGDGANRIVIGSTLGNPPPPADFQVYNANASWAAGDVISGVAFVLYTGSGSTMTISNLTPSTTYYFHVFEFNGTTSPNYNQFAAFDNPLSISTVASGPTIQASSIIFSNITTSSIDLSWSNGDGSQRIVVASNVGISGTPVNNTTYSANSFFGNGSQLNPGEYVVYDGTGNSVSVGGLNPNTIYDFQVFEYNGNPGSEVYLTNTATGNPSSETTSPMCVANAGGNNTINWCNDSPLDLFSSLTGTPDPGGTWTQISGPGAPVITGDQVDLLGELGGSYDFEYRVSEASCPDVTSIVTVNLTEQADAGTNNTVSACNTDSAFDLIGNLGGTPDTGGIWAQISGPGGVTTIGDNADLLGATPGTYVFEYTIFGGTCVNVSAQLTVNVDAAPAVLAGSDAEQCENSGSSLLNGTAADYSSVNWTTTGTGTFANANTLTPSYTFGPGETGTITFTLEAFGLGVCSNASDNVDLTITPAPFVNAGGNNTICEGGNWNIVDATASNYANITWTTSGSGSFTDANALTTTYNPGIGDIGLTTLTLNVDANGSCSATSGVKFLTINEAGFVLNPGNQVVCEGANTSAVIFTGTATSFSWTNDNPSIGLGASGSGNISSFTTLSSGSATITVTADNSGCAGPPEIFSINVNSNGSVVNPGNQTLCQGDNTSAIIFSGTATGYNWTNSNASIGLAASGSGNISSFTTTGFGVATITVTPVNGGCPGPSEIFTITVSQTPTVANAGGDQNICGTATTLSGNSPSVGFGTWSIISGVGGNIANSPDPTSPFTGLQGNIYVLRWTITNGSCIASFDDVTIDFNAIPTTSSAGTDQNQCNNGNFTLAGNTPVTGTGTWTVISGSATITTPGSPTSGVTAVAAGTSATLRWTITNGVCAALTDDVVITNQSAPTTSNAGADISQCNNSNFTLAGNTPGSGTGTWTAIVGTPTITTPGSPTSSVTGVALGASVTLRWTISNGICTSSIDDVILTNSAPPTTASAGVDQNQCNIGNFTLAGNTPGTGIGSWTLISGTATITTPAAPGSTVTGVPVGSSATLRWTISNGVCTASTDDVVITNQSAPTTSNAGTDIIQCNNANFTLAGNTPVSGTGTWTAIVGTPTITTPGSPTSSVTGVALGASVTLRWTISNGICASSIDDVILTNNATPTVSNPGNQTVCQGSNTATITFTGTGTSYNWTNDNPSIGLAASGGGNIAAFTTTASGIATITVTPDNSGCIGSPEMFTITVNSTGTVNNPGNQTACQSGNSTAVTFSGTATTYNWVNDNPSIGLAASGIGNIASFTTTDSGSATITVTPDNSGCLGIPEVFTITVNPVGTVSNPGDQALCQNSNTSTVTFAGTATSFNWTNNNSSIGLAASGIGDLPAFTATTPGMAIISVTPDNAGCTGSAEVFSITVNVMPTVSATNNTVTLNSGGETDIQIVATPGAIVSFVPVSPKDVLGANPGNGNTIAQVLTNITAVDQTVSYDITPSTAFCVGQTITVNVIVKGNLNFPTVITADSLALVSFYSSTKGQQWITNTNWLAGKVDTWFGVSVANQRVTGISLPANNLGGTLPSEILQLDAMLQLALAGNDITGEIIVPSQLTDLLVSDNNFTIWNDAPQSLTMVDVSGNNLAILPDLSLSTLSVFDVRNNKLVFDDLQPYLGQPAFSYIPQDKTETIVDILVDVGTTQTFTAQVAGDSYQWFINDVPIDTAVTNELKITNVQVKDDAVYHYTVTNATVPGLTLERNDIFMKVSSLKRDSIALRELYLNGGGPNWNSATNWVSTSLTTVVWEGVQIQNSRVVGLTLPGNNITGAVPTLKDIGNLQNVNVSNNHITDLPDLTALSSIQTLNVSENDLQFNSLEVNAAIPGINYANQRQAGTGSYVQIHAGGFYTIGTDVAGSANEYQWRKGGQSLAGETSNELQITNIGRANMGEFDCQVTNPLVPNLTLTTRPDTVYAVANIDGSVFEANNTLASGALVTLLKVTSEGGYDTTATYELLSGQYTFTDIVLADYQVHAILADNTDGNALPTYYTNTIFWEEASKVELNEDVSDIDIAIQYLVPPVVQGTGVIKGFVEEEQNPSGRVAATKRVGGAGVATRRVEDSGRGKETYTLVGYVLTNEDGEFEFTQLREATYKLNIQYPGYPMDETSDVVFDIGWGLNAEVSLVATVQEGQIVVKKIIVTGTWSREGYKMEMYPNPAKHVLNLEFPHEDKSRVVRIFSINGTEVIEEKATGNSATVSLKPISSGSYFLYVFEGGKIKQAVKLSIE